MTTSAFPEPEDELSGEQVEQLQELSSDDIEHLREKSKTDLFFLAKFTLGYSQVCESAHGALCAFMVREKLDRRMVLMPRGHLKTTICTISDSIRLSLIDPSTRVLIQNEVFDNASDMLTELKNHWVQGVVLRALFPELVPTKFNGPGVDWAKDGASITRTAVYKESTYTAAGSGGSPQSKHFKYVKNDDLVGERHKESDTEMDRAIRWCDSQEPLLDSPMDQIDFYGTRKTMSDVYAHTIEKYGSEIAVFVREPIENGVPIFPIKYPLHKLLAIMNNTPEVWAHDFMNNPIGKGGLDWGKGLLRTYDVRSDGKIYFEHHLNGDLYCVERRELDIVVTVDPNSGKLLAPDKAAVVVHGVSSEEQIFILETWSGRVTPTGLIDKTWELCQKWKPRLVGFEDAGQQNSMFYFEQKCLKEGRTFELRPLTHMNQYKENRIRKAIDIPIRARRVYVLPSMMTLIGQIQLFPQLAKHNWDEIDCFSYGPQLYGAGMDIEALEADEEAESKILELRGVTGYGVSVG